MTRNPLYRFIRSYLLLTSFCLISKVSISQISFTANDSGSVPPYNGYFLYGTNGGYYGNSWDGISISNIAAGNPALGVPGVGSKTFRLTLPESFLEYYGYDMSIPEYAHYFSIGARDNTAFVGFPSNLHKELAAYGGCGVTSEMFANMYLPIWDGGANGTPVNDDNYYALYLYKIVTRYKSSIRFWEIMNEPDFDIGANGYKGPGLPGNWWDNNPPPCDLQNMRAPVFSYIRMLRISYEVIKSVDPTAYVTTGGIGFASFLDAILRNTDNPVDGSVDTDYPLRGGAYFDVLSFHSYPMYGLRYWDNASGGFINTRHSDSGADEFIKTKNSMQQVLTTYGYDNSVYPAKIFICTENNIPKKSFSGMIGSDLAQLNYVIKALVKAQQNDIRQSYLYMLGDTKTYAESTDPYEMMGLYQKLEGIGPVTNGGVYQQLMNNEGIAFKTTSDLLRNLRYDAGITSSMNLPANIGGGAFSDSLGNHMYVLWAKTTVDLSEAASASYSFPLTMNVAPLLTKRNWNFSATGDTIVIPFQNIALTGTPIFLTDNMQFLKLRDEEKKKAENKKQLSLVLYPNPTVSTASLSFRLSRPSTVKITVTDIIGREVKSLTYSSPLASGNHTITLPGLDKLASGTYTCRFETLWMAETRRFTVVHQ